ncbi:MAG: sigma-54-dependent Fis family transcriptional regulator [Acidobacteria bacterium]|nr:sigma-54-dependent Fis family transcriptional regulator [Acidobacteriota bacterium]
MPMSRILVVDDEADMLEVCQDTLAVLGVEVETERLATRALERLKGNAFDLMIADLKMPGMDGLELLRQAKELDPEMLVLMITGYPTIETAVEAIRQGAFDYVAKPFAPDQLRVTVERALRQKRLRDENLLLRRQLALISNSVEIVGQSAAIQGVLELMRRVGPTDSNILVMGESGTGKELIARGIHAQSRRQQKSFVPLDCGALPETLAESELFGYEKGAFTGATVRTPGLLEIANGGTFFLDEVCELTAPLQVKLLRVLQERQFRRVGGRQLIAVDVRIIAATNRNVPKEVESGRFREDLYYRLNTIVIHAPPLRERPEDIPLLATHFSQKFAGNSSHKIGGIAPETLQALSAYPWPGNVRELSNVIERAVSLCRGEYVDVCDLPDDLIHTERVCVPLSWEHTYHRAKREVIEAFEKDYLSRMLLESGGNITQTARIVGLPRTSLQRLVRKYQIRLARPDS